MLTETELKAIKPLRYLRKVSDGGCLHLLVTPKGGRYWRFAYRFACKYKTLSLGVYPHVSLEQARSRHRFARNPLAHGLDPSALKAALGKDLFVVTMREWEMARHVSGPAFQSRVKSRRPHPASRPESDR
jgi:Arm DNA-binding domain